MSDEIRQSLPTDPTDWRGPAGHVLSRDAVLAHVPDERTDPPTYRAVTVGDALAMQAALTEAEAELEQAKHEIGTLLIERTRADRRAQHVEQQRDALEYAIGVLRSGIDDAFTISGYDDTTRLSFVRAAAQARPAVEG